MTFSSHPFQIVEFTTRWRHNVHSNLTRPFDATQYVRFDAVPESTGGITVGYSFVRDTLDETMTLHLLPHTALRLGYGYDNYNQTNRAFADLRDDTLRITFDAMGNKHISFRLGYEYVRRTGSGFDEQAIIDSNAQPGLRYYDDADRNRNRVTGVVTASPIDKLDFTFSGYYNGDAYTNGIQFGLLNNSNLSYNVGVDYAPTRKIAFGASIGRNDNSAFQKSRNANPAPDPTWTDPNRDWWLTNGEASRNIDAYVNIIKLFRKVDLRFAYSFSDSNNSLIYGGPRILALSAIVDINTGLRNFIPLPNVTNQWNSISAEVKYHLAGRYGLAFGFRHENLGIRDFSTLNLSGTELPRITYLGGLMTGYGNRPYNGTTGTFRVFRNF